MTDTRPETHQPIDIAPPRLSEFLTYVWFGDFAVVTHLLETDLDLLHTVHPDTGLTALHIAVGRNSLLMTKILVEAGAKFIADAHGRFPSVIAAEMEVSEELADYIVEAEARTLEAQKPEGV
jgi:uncharacterized protein